MEGCIKSKEEEELTALYARREWENCKEKGVFATFRKKVDEVPLKKNPVADSRTLFPPVFVMLPFIHTHDDDQISSAYPVVVAWADRSDVGPSFPSLCRQRRKPD